MEEKQIKLNDIVVVVKDTPVFIDGAVVKVIDTSVDDPESLLVATLETIGRFDNDMIRILTEGSFWVKRDRCYPLDFTMPTKQTKKGLFQRIKEFLFG